MASKIELVPETVRRMMQKNTAVMDEYNMQIRKNTEKLESLLAEFKETINER